MITALQARLLTNESASIQEALEVLNKLVLEAAAEGQAYIEVPSDMLVSRDGMIQFKSSALSRKLDDLGYRQSVYTDKEAYKTWFKLSWIDSDY